MEDVEQEDEGYRRPHMNRVCDSPDGEVVWVSDSSEWHQPAH